MPFTFDLQPELPKTALLLIMILCLVLKSKQLPRVVEGFYLAELGGGVVEIAIHPTTVNSTDLWPAYVSLKLDI